MNDYGIQIIHYSAIREYVGSLSDQRDAAVINRMLNWLSQRCAASGAKLPAAIRQAPWLTIRGFGSEDIARSLRRMGSRCREPWHYGCMMEVCYENGLLFDRTEATGFARTLVALGIVRYKGPDALHKLAGTIASVLKMMPVRYRDCGDNLLAFRDKCQSISESVESTI